MLVDLPASWGYGTAKRAVNTDDAMHGVWQTMREHYEAGRLMTERSTLIQNLYANNRVLRIDALFIHGNQLRTRQASGLLTGEPS